jgi:hypothetical protein
MPADKYPSELADRFIVRLPDGMRDKIAEAAKRNNRSMNSEIVARLQQTLEPAAASEFARRFDRLSLQVDALHKWMQRQPEDGGIEMHDDGDPIHFGQVRPPEQPPRKIKGGK